MEIPNGSGLLSLSSGGSNIMLTDFCKLNIAFFKYMYVASLEFILQEN